MPRFYYALVTESDGEHVTIYRATKPWQLRFFSTPLESLPETLQSVAEAIGYQRSHGIYPGVDQVSFDGAAYAEWVAALESEASPAC